MSDDAKKRLEQLLLVLAAAAVTYLVSLLRPVEPAPVQPTPVQVTVEQKPGVFPGPTEIRVVPQE